MRSSTRAFATGKRLLIFRRLTPSAKVGMAVLFVIILAAAVPVLFTRVNPDELDIVARLSPPSAAHPIGTDHIGRDLLSRLVYGARVSLLVAVASVGGAVAIGVLLGLLAGYYGRWADGTIMRLVDVFLAFPAILLALALVAALGAGITSVIAALVLVFWTQYARVVRAVTLAEKEKAYVEAAPSWGWTLAFGTRYLRDAPHIATFSGLAIMATVLGFNLLGDGIRDLLDPKFRPQ